MATKSIFKNINIKEKKQIGALVGALEMAEKSKGKEVNLSRTFTELKGAQIDVIFGARK